MPELVPVTMLRAGQVAEVRQVIGPVDQVRRLDEIGLRSGAVIEMVRPGSPCIVRIGGGKLCLRQTEFLSVLVAERKSA